MEWPNKALKSRAHVRDWSNPKHPGKIGIQGTLFPDLAKNRVLLLIWDGCWKYGQLPIQRLSTEAAPLENGQVTSLFPAAFFFFKYHSRLETINFQWFKKPIRRLTEGLHIVYLSELEFDHYLQTLQKCDIKQVKYLENKHAQYQAATR